MTAASSSRATALPSQTRQEEVLSLYRRGHGVSEIAEMFNVQKKTVMNNLWESFRLFGETFAAEPILAESTLEPDEQGRVLAAFDKLGVERLRPIFDELHEEVPFDELHILRLYYVALGSSTNPLANRTLSDVQEAILRCVKTFPGQLPRSSVAKLLVGSDSARVAEYAGYQEYGRFSHLPRHAVMAEVDKLIEENVISLDEQRCLISLQ